MEMEETDSGILIPKEKPDTPPKQCGPLEIQDPKNRDKATKALDMLWNAMELYKGTRGLEHEIRNRDAQLKAYNTFSKMLLGEDQPEHEVWT